MRYVCKEYDGSKSVSDVFQNSEQTFLTWKSTNNSDCIVVKSEYKKEFNIERFCENLDNNNPGINLKECKVFFEMEESFVPYNRFYKVVYVDSKQHALTGGINISERGCRYTVLACSFETEESGEEICTIYKPNPNTIYLPYTDIQFEVRMDMSHVENDKSGKSGFMGWFKSKPKEEETSFYKIEFDKDYSSQCSDNDLSYRIGNFEIPITKRLLKSKTFYIKTEQKPIIMNKSEGLKLLINGKEQM